jgi:hypothetical protein
VPDGFFGRHSSSRAELLSDSRSAGFPRNRGSPELNEKGTAAPNIFNLANGVATLPADVWRSRKWPRAQEARQRIDERCDLEPRVPFTCPACPAFAFQKPGRIGTWPTAQGSKIKGNCHRVPHRPTGKHANYSNSRCHLQYHRWPDDSIPSTVHRSTDSPRSGRKREAGRCIPRWCHPTHLLLSI